MNSILEFHYPQSQKAKSETIEHPNSTLSQKPIKREIKKHTEHKVNQRRVGEEKGKE